MLPVNARPLIHPVQCGTLKQNLLRPVSLLMLSGVFLASGQGLAQSRPSEDDLFGGSASQNSTATTAAPSTNAASGSPAASASDSASSASDGSPSGPATLKDSSSAEQSLFDGGNDAPVLSSDAAPDDPLRLGGMFYTRWLGSLQADTPVNELQVSAPSLLDVYLDARPNDRVRAYVVGRLQYNPLSTSYVVPGLSFGSTTSSSTSVLLNQLWLNFDIARTVFVTAGKQSIKWGTGRFWNPTDFLQPVHKDPLEPVDVRTGVPMIKFHLPWESKGWNFYAVTTFDGLQVKPQLDRTGLGLRAEAVFGTVELGLDGLLARYQSPKVGADISAGVGPIDVYGEVGLRRSVSTPLWREVEDPVSDDLADAYESWTPDGYYPQATLGLNWSTTLGDNDSLTVGAEYFYNSIGYEDSSIYPWLIFSEAYTPFYLGKHYASVFALLMGPGKFEDSSISFSTLANLNDLSALSRLDFSTTVLTHMRVEAYGALHWGNPSGEFHFGLETDPLTIDGQSIPALDIAPPSVDVGVSLRVNI